MKNDWVTKVPVFSYPGNFEMFKKYAFYFSMQSCSRIYIFKLAASINSNMEIIDVDSVSEN